MSGRELGTATRGLQGHQALASGLPGSPSMPPALQDAGLPLVPLFCPTTPFPGDFLLLFSTPWLGFSARLKQRRRSDLLGSGLLLWAGVSSEEACHPLPPLPSWLEGGAASGLLAPAEPATFLWGS